MKLTFIVLALAMTVAPLASAEENPAKLSRKLWAAFKCHNYALMVEEKDRAQQFFKTGLAAGRKFLKAAQAGEISKDEWQKNVPVGISWRLGGPNDEFRLGRIYEVVSTETWKQVDQEVGDKLGDLAEQMRKSIAERRFTNEHCDLIAE